MSCEQSEIWMMDAFDGALAAADHRQLMAHLDRCSHCRTEWDALYAVEQMFASPSIVFPQPGFVDRVETRLARFEAQRRTLVGGLILLGAAAALCLLTLPSLLNGRNPIEAYLGFLHTVYDIVRYAMVLGYQLASALWLSLEALASSVDVSLANLLAYAAAIALAAIVWRRSLASQRVRTHKVRNSH